MLEEDRSPSRQVGELDNRGSHFYLALYWAQALADQTDDAGGGAVHTARRAAGGRGGEDRLRAGGVQGSAVELGGYYHPDSAKATAAMRPSATFNEALEEFAAG